MRTVVWKWRRYVVTVLPDTFLRAVSSCVYGRDGRVSSTKTLDGVKPLEVNVTRPCPQKVSSEFHFSLRRPGLMPRSVHVEFVTLGEDFSLSESSRLCSTFRESSGGWTVGPLTIHFHRDIVWLHRNNNNGFYTENRAFAVIVMKMKCLEIFVYIIFAYWIILRIFYLWNNWKALLISTQNIENMKNYNTY